MRYEDGSSGSLLVFQYWISSDTVLFNDELYRNPVTIAMRCGKIGSKSQAGMPPG